MNFANEMELVSGSNKIIKEAKARKQSGNKTYIYVIPNRLNIEQVRIELI